MYNFLPAAYATGFFLGIFGEVQVIYIVGIMPFLMLVG